ncbi:DsbA family oxidoreductase [Maricaulis maris]|uniref:DsbA family oxidoreductase n=1 Tax=Maricaulis maris TaxID=74318 RepID=UPI001F2FF692|nr:DsbA family oxidoreductase [Maricaulis maris]
MTVDIVSDLVCPWCWLGKRHWDEARKLTAEIEVETVWRPFQLDPTLAREGRPYKDYMREKFSGAEASGRWKAMRDHLEQAGPAAGIEFRFDDITMRPNTLNAHRLMRWAGGQGETPEMAEALFAAFFNQGRDIGDTAVLAELAGQAGLDAAVTADLLATDRDEKAVWEEELFYRKLGVSGVPTYIFNGRFAVSGAQEAAVLADAIRQAVKEPAETE